MIKTSGHEKITTRKNLGRTIGFLLLIGFLVLSFSEAVSAKDCGGAIACDCGDTVVDDYILESDLNCPHAGDGLIVGDDGIHIDGNGHTIYGNCFGVEFGCVGIKNIGYDYVTISNLTIEDFNAGIELKNAANYNTLTNNIIKGGDDGIYLSDSKHNEITHNYIHHNSEGISMWCYSNSNTIFRNTIDDNNYGILIEDSSNNNEIDSNAVCGNSVDDIFVSSSTGNYGDNFCDDLNAGGNLITCSKSCNQRGCVADAHPATVFTCGDTVTESCSFSFDLYCGATGLVVGADDVSIDGNGYKLTGNGGGYGIKNNGYDHATVQNLEIKNFYYGFYLYNNADDNAIKGCTIDNTGYGVFICNSKNNQIIPSIGWVPVTIPNHIANNRLHGIYLFRADETLIQNSYINDNGASGIYFYESDNNSIEYNTIEDNIEHGIRIRQASQNNSMQNNTITQNNIHGVYLEGRSNDNLIVDNEIYDNDEHGINVENSDSNSITSNNVTDNSYGVWLDNSAHNLVSDNNIFYNDLYGVGVNNSDLIEIKSNLLNDNAVGICIKENSINTNITNNNQIRDNNYGINIMDSQNTIVRDNDVSRHGWYGFYIIGSANTSVVNNTINDNINEAGTGGTGILVGSSQDTVIYANKITKGWTGIYLSPSVENTTIIENYICNNTNLDIFNQGTDNAGWLNYCDTVDSWEDSGSSGGCMYSCSELNCTDLDGDGYYVYDMLECPIGNDCNDNDASINPGAAEIYCNGIDEDCNGVSDCFCRDADDDGAPAKTATCPMGFDCDDSDPNRYPGAIEINCNGIDEDCDGEDQCDCTDNDGDGYALEGGDCGLMDCNDDNPNIHPNAAEIYCNGIDEDCSGSDDCSCIDNDGDGYSARTWSCPTGTDCDDSTAFIHPGRDEIPYNFIDDNCNGEYDEGCNYSCTSDEDCSYGRTCSAYGTCQCPHGILDFYVGGEHIPLCDPVGIPADTPCEHGWPHHEGSDVNYNEGVPACDLYEVTNYDLLSHAEKARDCCVDYINTGVISSGCHAYTDDVYVQSGLATALNYDNLRRFIGLYELYGMGSEAEYMQEYYDRELKCGKDSFAGFGIGCLGHTWTEKCCRESHWWCIPDPVNCYDGVHPNTALLKCKEEVGTPSGWASDTDLGANGCCFSDLPAHASTEILSTGTCVDYSVVLTTLLRMSGYKNDEVYSTRSDCPGDSGHCFNLIRFPGDSKYTLVDTVENCNGYHPMSLPECNDCYYWDYENCANDMGRVSCPAKSDVWGCGCTEVGGSSFSRGGVGSGGFASNATVPPNPTFNTTSTTEGNITVTRTVFDEIHLGEIVRVNITIENANDYAINVTVRDSIAGAILYNNLSIPEIPVGAIAPPMASVEFSDSIPAHGERSFAYILQPQFVGPYTHYATEVHADDTLIYLDTQTTEVNCVSDGMCDGSVGENYMTCPQDCWSGAEDGICNPIADGLCDNDCIEGLDPDCQFEEMKVFDTGKGTYPSISGTHNGTILLNQTITVSTLYTYPCAGTGGHTESIELYENTILIANGTWNGYVGDYHNVTLHNLTGESYVTLRKNQEYRYVIKTGSYPQIHHTPALPTTNGWINCTQFIDANGKGYNDWIPAIKLFL